MSKIGTEQDAYNLSGIGTPVPNKCITATRVRELGCSIFDEDTFPVADNQLVEKERLEVKTTRYFGAIVTIPNTGMGDIVSYVYPYYKNVPSQEPSTYMVRWDLIDYKDTSSGRNCYFGKPENENDGELYVNYDEHNVQFVYNPDTGIYEPVGLGTYFHYDLMLMPLEKAFATTSHGNTKVEGTDNQFITTAPDTLRSIATSAFYSLPEFNYKNGEALITLDQDNKAFTIDMTLNKEILSDENGNKSEHYFVYHLKVSNIGTTTLDYESLIPEDFDFWTWAQSY